MKFFYDMPSQVGFCLKSLVFQARSYIPGHVIDWTWSSWTWATLCCLFVIYFHFKSWFKKVVFQKSCILLLMKCIIYHIYRILYYLDIKQFICKASLYCVLCIAYCMYFILCLLCLSYKIRVLENFFLKLFALQQTCQAYLWKFVVTRVSPKSTTL